MPAESREEQAPARQGPAGHARGPARARARPRLTRFGLAWLALLLALVLIALYKAINLLLLLATFLLGLGIVNAILAGRRLRRLQARRRVPDAVFAGVPVPVEVEVRSTGPGSQLGLRIEEGPEEQRVTWFVPRLARAATVRLRQEMTFPRRGRYPWGELVAWSGYPFGLVARAVALAPGGDLVVLPRLGRVHRGRLRRYLHGISPMPARERRAQQRHATAQTEFHGLRAFRSGDSPRWIHWRTTARCGELMVREFEALPTDNLILVLDLASAAAPLQAVEDAVSLAATICWEWCRQRGDRLVLATTGPAPAVLDGLTGPGHALQLLQHLAGAAPADAAARSALVNRLAATPLPRASLLVVSIAADGLADTVARRLNRRASGVDASRLTAVDFYERPAHVT